MSEMKHYIYRKFKKKREKNKKGLELILINLFQDRFRTTFPRIKVLSSLINKNVHFLPVHIQLPFPLSFFSLFLLLLSLILSLIKIDQRNETHSFLFLFFSFFLLFFERLIRRRETTLNEAKGREEGGEERGLNDEREAIAINIVVMDQWSGLYRSSQANYERKIFTQPVRL